MNTTDFDAFDSPNFPPLAVFSGQRRLSGAVNWNLVLKPVLTRGTGKELILCTNNNTATENVNVLYIYPGITENAMNFVPSALILRSFGAGNVPDIVLQTLKTWKNSVLVVNISQCEGGSVSSTYAIGTELEGIGVVNGGDMTFEAAYTKLYIACILKAEISDRKKYFEEISKGEKTTPSLRVQVLDLVHMYRLAAKSKA
ncbi:L-asparaginase 1-like [Saccostrea cucullata]|uniref:L-asparaginase 1-like n=1 Tax=Saccostrea cuccullata TaxID=36930 RepID=UPI002ED4E5D4